MAEQDKKDDQNDDGDRCDGDCSGWEATLGWRFGEEA